MVRVPGSHAPNSKNRSSKHLIPLTKIRPAIRSASNAALNEMVKSSQKSNGRFSCRIAEVELSRRRAKRDKREAKGK